VHHSSFISAHIEQDFMKGSSWRLLVDTACSINLLARHKIACNERGAEFK
jgi:hypothetical protein